MDNKRFMEIIEDLKRGNKYQIKIEEIEQFNDKTKKMEKQLKRDRNFLVLRNLILFGLIIVSADISFLPITIISIIMYFITNNSLGITNRNIKFYNSINININNQK